MDNWTDEILCMNKSGEWGILTYTMHPLVIGRGYRILNFERLVATLAFERAVFSTMEAAVAEARTRLS